MRRAHFLKNSIAFVCMIVSICCLLVVIISVLRLPEVSVNSIRPRKIKISAAENYRIGKFGEMMIEMLPEDLAFTIFMASEKAFERDLRLGNNSFVGEKMNDTYAVLTRVLGFSVVPRAIFSASVPHGKEISFDSLSGFSLFIMKDLEGMLMVNGVGSKRVDVRRGKIVVHIMDGVIMDAEFEQSFSSDYGEED